MTGHNALSASNKNELVTFKKLRVVLGNCLLGFELIRRRSFIIALLGLGSMMGHDAMSSGNSNELMSHKKLRVFLGPCLLGSCLLEPCLLGFDLVRRKSFIVVLPGLDSMIGHDTMSTGTTISS